MYTHFSKFIFAQKVYLVTDPEQLVRLITDIEFSIGGQTVYTVMLANISSRHYEFELSDVKDEALRLGFEGTEKV